MVRVHMESMSEEECAKVLQVIQRDFDLRQQEKDRLSKLEDEAEKETKRAAILARQAAFNKQHCLHCYKSFFFIINPREQCCVCQHFICRKCSEFLPEKKEYVCKVCRQTLGVKEKSFDWFYESVTKRFKHFGSAKVVRSLLKRRSETASDVEGAEGEVRRSGRPTLQGVFANVNESTGDGNGLLARLSPQQLEEFRFLLTTVVTDMKKELDSALPPVTHADSDDDTSNAHNHLLTGYRLRVQTIISNLQQQLQQQPARGDLGPLDQGSRKQPEVKNAIVREIEKLLGSPVDVSWDEVTSDFFSEDEQASDPQQRAFGEQLAEAVISKVWVDARNEREELRRRLQQEPSPPSRRPSSAMSDSGSEEPMSCSSRTGSLTRIPEEDSSSTELLPPPSLEEEEEEAAVPDDAEILENLDFLKKRQGTAYLPHLADGRERLDLSGTSDLDPDSLALGPRALEVDTEITASRISLSPSLHGDTSHTDSSAHEESDVDGEVRRSQAGRPKKNWFMQKNVSPYENCGGRLVGKELGDPVTMHVPRGVSSCPRIGTKRSDDLSDMSENEESGEEDVDSDESGLDETDAGRWRRNRNTRRTAEIVASGMFLLPGEQPAQPKGPTKGMILALAKKRTLEQVFVQQGEGLVFRRAPEATSVAEGDLAKLSCEIDTDASIDVFWYRERGPEGQLEPLEDGEKYETSVEGSAACLDIYSVSAEDTGRYMIVVVGENGECSCSLPLTVKGDSGVEKSEPQLLKKPESVELVEGDQAKFTCRVAGHPAPRLLWYRDGNRLKHGDRYRIERVGPRAQTLHIDYAILEDGGHYSVAATSAAGRADHGFSVIVDKRPVSDEGDDTLTSLSKRLGSTHKATHQVTRNMLDSASRMERLQNQLQQLDNNLAALDGEGGLDTITRGRLSSDERALKDSAARLRVVTNVADECLHETITQHQKSPGQVRSLRASVYVEPDIKVRGPSSSGGNLATLYKDLDRKPTKKNLDESFKHILKSDYKTTDGVMTYTQFEQEYQARVSSREKQKQHQAIKQHEKDIEDAILGKKAHELEKSHLERQQSFRDRTNNAKVDTARYRRDFETPGTKASPTRHWEVNVPYSPTSPTATRPSQHMMTVLQDQALVAEGQASNLRGDLANLQQQLQQPSLDGASLGQLELQVARSVAKVEENEDMVRSLEAGASSRGLSPPAGLSSPVNEASHDMSQDSGLGDTEHKPYQLPSVNHLKDRYSQDNSGFVRIGSLTARSFPAGKRRELQRAEKERIANRFTLPVIPSSGGPTSPPPGPSNSLPLLPSSPPPSLSSGYYDSDEIEMGNNQF